MTRTVLILLLTFPFLARTAGPAGSPDTAAPDARPALTLAATVEVDSQGVFLDQLILAETGPAVPHVQLTNAPAPDKALTLTRARVLEALGRHAPELAATNLAGPDTVRIARRTRALDEAELRELLAAALQKEAGDAGELELRLSRPWPPHNAPDDPLSIRMLELPAAGLGQNMVVRFDLLAGVERFETCQLVVRCRLLREVPVARANLQRGQRLRDAEVALERRDVFSLRDTLAPNALADESLELAEPVRANQPLFARSVRTRPLIRRGGLVEGLIQDGTLNITLKVEALEDGFAGQTLRLRNPRTRRECLGKVQNEQTVLLVL